ncbi:E3 ubiquitin-protein ligase TRIM35-like [Corythoichthys intestinalis]|uniref:E3 ubiquitin-protein ligase TRIM35-like n=1 Tax=Corythoichthys intestinalis TaxID=161448 RepID=UPI0025A52115|nr:E3 ubiquitin-protein ligase TRIM35-like [Corythoichthys intestinalis]
MEGQGERSCPVFRTQFRSMDPYLNLALKNLCENMTPASVESEDICSLHQEELKLFCLDQQQLVCLVCRDTKIHAGLQNAKERLKDYNNCSETCNEKAECKIKKDFEELRRFLDIQEETRLADVWEEEKMKTQTITEKIVALDIQMAALLDVIRSTAEQLPSHDVSFLKNVWTAMNRIQEPPNEPELLRGALLDEAKHVGNLKFNVLERMKETLSYSSVILDPNTAHPVYSLTKDLTSLSTAEEAQQRPKKSRVE